MKTLVLLITFLHSSFVQADLSPADEAKKFSRLGFLEPVADMKGRYYSIDVVTEDPDQDEAYYLVNSVRVTESQLYDLLHESFKRDPAVEARVTVSRNLTVEQMIIYTRGLLEPQAPKLFPRISIRLEAAGNESIFHARGVHFSLTPRQKSEIEKFRAGGTKFPYRIDQSK